MIKDFVLQGVIDDISPEQCNDIKIVWKSLILLKSSIQAIENERFITIDVEDCGAAYRFIMALAAAVPSRIFLTGTKRLLQRPIQPLVDALNGVGANIKQTLNGWLIYGKNLKINTLEVDASLSSQFASALILIAPLIKLKSLKLPHQKIASFSYFEMSLAVMSDFPVEVVGFKNDSHNIGELGDWSAAVFWFAHACLNPENQYSLYPLSTDSIQPDSAIVEWFEKLGLKIECSNKIIDIHYITKSNLPKITYDMSQNLDLVPVMAALACKLPADFTFKNVENLRYKESDRLTQLVKQLSPFSEISFDDNSLRVVGNVNNDFSKAKFDSMDDHRLAMAFLLLTSQNNILGLQCIKKSYKNLLNQLNNIL